MNRDVILVIRKDAATYLAVPMPLHEANKVLKMHREGSLPSVIGGSLPDGGGWSFECKEITLMHTQELETLNQNQQPHQQASMQVPQMKYPISGFR